MALFSPRMAPQRRHAAHHDDLSPAQRRGLILAIAALHGAGAWGLWQVQEVRDAVREAAPMFVSFIAPEQPPKPAPPPPPVIPRPIPQKLRPAPVIAAAPSPVAAAFVVPVAPAPPLPPLPAPAPVVVAQAPTPPAPPPPAPKLIPASAVQYLEPLQPVYPRLSRRNNESGRVTVRVYIDTAGLPSVVQVNQSSGHARLDDAAVDAVRKARFKPYLENGQPLAAWALIPLDFELEK